MAAITICSDFGAQKNKVCHGFHCLPIYLHEVMGPDAMIFVFWMLSFKPIFSLSLMKGKEWKSWLKAQHSENEDHGIWSHHFMQIDGETMETVSDFIFGGSKITADGDCSHEIKRCLLLGRKVMTNLDSILKSRDVTLSTKVRQVKAMVFPVVVYGY